MLQRKPVIGVAGGIGSGKSFIARLFGELGCLVIDADEQVRQAYRRDDVKRALRQWWGGDVFTADGEVSRPAVGRVVFADPAQLARLEQLLHPLVGRMRDDAMEAAAGDARVIAFVWDIPLLFEKGYDRACDAVVFVDASWESRLGRVRATRRWDEADLRRRENLQFPLDNKRRLAHYVLSNTADVAFARNQVRDILSRIVAGPPTRPS